MQENRYVIHFHKSRRPHFDLCLELDGVLKSWAVPKEPSDKEKRLAVQVDDHDLDYIDFEGTIPEGSYGAGKVEIWDKGTFTLDERTDDKLVFELKGKRLKGDYCLIRFKKAGPKNWLFFRKRAS